MSASVLIRSLQRKLPYCFQIENADLTSAPEPHRNAFYNSQKTLDEEPIARRAKSSARAVLLKQLLDLKAGIFFVKKLNQ